MTHAIPDDLRAFVRQRGQDRCEYCLIHTDCASLFPHEVDHIIARKHRGLTEENNLAWACAVCNRRKGSDLASIDSGKLVRLLNPRIDLWDEHFRLEDGCLVPLTAIGRVTAFLLKFNRRKRVQARRIQMVAGLYP